MEIDALLLQQCRKGDRKGQYQLFRRCFPVLMSVCLRYKKDEGDAKAALNEGFLKILQNLDKYSSSTPFEAWIRRIMINTLIDDFRKNRKVRELMEYRDFSDNGSHQDPVDFNEADKMFDAEQLTALIRELPPMSQKVFNLFAIDGYSHKEVSDMLQISEGTSKWHLSFARKRLKEMIKALMKSSKVI
jgi:RNA polymerase sigma factor (sigma-70 family)